MAQTLTQKEWVHVGKVLSNVNRFKILRVLWDGGEKSVTDMAGFLNISIKATSRHLVIMERQGILLASGKQGHVYYRVAQDMPTVLKNVLAVILSNVR